jgi:hypothetical protein
MASEINLIKEALPLDMVTRALLPTHVSMIAFAPLGALYVGVIVYRLSFLTFWC